MTDFSTEVSNKLLFTHSVNSNSNKTVRDLDYVIFYKGKYQEEKLCKIKINIER